MIHNRNSYLCGVLFLFLFCFVNFLIIVDLHCSVLPGVFCRVNGCSPCCVSLEVLTEGDMGADVAAVLSGFTLEESSVRFVGGKVLRS